MKQLELEKGTRVVGMPHTTIYASLCQIAPMLSTATTELNAHVEQHGDWHSDQSTLELRQQGKHLYDKKAFLQSAGRMYPALYFEAYANFLATVNSLEYKNDFDRLSTPKKLKIYTYLITGQHMRPAAVEFVKRLVKMRDAEVHQKPTVDVIGNNQAKAHDYFMSQLHQCTLYTIMNSMRVLTNELYKIYEKAEKPLPKQTFISFTVPGCHEEQNKHFVLDVPTD